MSPRYSESRSGWQTEWPKQSKTEWSRLYRPFVAIFFMAWLLFGVCGIVHKQVASQTAAQEAAMALTKTQTPGNNPAMESIDN